MKITEVKKNKTQFSDIKIGEAFWYQDCIFVRVHNYGDVNAVCIKNENHAVPYAAKLYEEHRVEPTTVTVEF